MRIVEIIFGAEEIINPPGLKLRFKFRTPSVLRHNLFWLGSLEGPVDDYRSAINPSVAPWLLTIVEGFH